MADAAARMPRQIPFIIANEGCERFSFYGMRNILTPFLTAGLLAYLPEGDQKPAAVEIFHTFVIGVYFFPLLGGWLSDRFFGKFRTIFSFSVIYVLGQACLAAFATSRAGVYTGLFLIALGSGGIKPLVASFMGDQFDSRNKHLAKLAFDAFYWIINFGSLFASVSMSWCLHSFGARVAFAIPGLLMVMATVVFVAGRPRYVMVPVAPPDPHSFLRVVGSALLAKTTGRPRVGLGVAATGAVGAAGAFILLASGALDFPQAFSLALLSVLGFGGVGAALVLERARGIHPDAAVDGVRAVLRVLVLFALVTPFWSLFDQKASIWVLQADAMGKPSWFFPEMMQGLNPALVLALIPLNNLVVFPWLRRRGWNPTPLRKMTAGIVLTGLAWIIVAVFQLVLDGGATFSIAWQVAPYVFLTLGEVLVSATGLEFAYSQAPPAMKGAIMSFWNLSTAVGSVWVVLAGATIRRPGVAAAIGDTGLSVTAFYMFFFAAFALVAALVFGLAARRYREVDHYRA